MAVYECGTGGSVFAEIAHGVSDGFKFDTKDTVLTSTARDVSCYAPVGTLLGEIRIPETVSNQSFGGAKRRRLFITATTSLYALYVGARVWRSAKGLTPARLGRLAVRLALHDRPTPQ